MTEPNQENQKIRHDWYQTDSHVIINILCKNVKPDDFDLNYSTDSINLSFSVENGIKHNLIFKLLHEINTTECSYKITPSKIEIKLKKKEGFRWITLEEHGSSGKDLEQSQPKYPSSSRKPKDWDKLVVDIKKSEESKPEGDALNALFQKIYSEGSDEVRKAMNKSFTESGGTVLSTNWGEVQKEKVDIKPPDGLEWKKWNS